MAARGHPLGARSSAGEHCLDMAGVTGSIPVAPTIPQALDRALRAIARRYGMALGGPNSEGLMIAERRLAASFSPVVGPEGGPLAPETARGRPIAVVGQSGAMTFAFVSRGRPRQLRFEAVISSGNQVDLEAHDYVDYWLETGGPEIFILYIEQIADGGRFRAVAERAL